MGCSIRHVVGDSVYDVPCVVAAGFSGALRPDYRVGDIVVATEIVDRHQYHLAAVWPLPDLGIFLPP